MAGWFQSLSKTRERFSGALKRLFTGTGKPDAETVEELTELLITADMPARLAQEITDQLETSSDGNPKTVLRGMLLDALGSQTSVPSPFLEAPDPANPLVILLVGINGSGKTTTAAKLAQLAKEMGRKPILGAADTFRAAGSHQLKLWAERIGCPAVIGETGADAAAVAYDTLDAALARGCDTVLIDTAGRMHTREPLMNELAKTRNALNKRKEGTPQHTWVVLDAMLGQNAVIQARQFNASTPLTGVVITKLDGSSKGGFLFAIRQELQQPIFYTGLGEAAGDLAPFNAGEYVDALLGLSTEGPSA